MNSVITIQTSNCPIQNDIFQPMNHNPNPAQASNHSLNNISIGFLNVCGLKRRLQYPDFCQFIQKYDIICFAETKLDQADVISCNGYTFYSQPRRQKYYRKSGGIGFLVRDSLSKYMHVVSSESEYISWIKLSKQFHQYDEDILLGCVYVPPQQSRFYNNDEFDCMEQEITSACSTGQYVYILGDFNAQTSDLIDYTTSDTFLSDFFHFDQETVEFYDQKSALESLGIQTNRVSRDKKKSNSGFKLIDICKNHNLSILNGRFGQDRNVGALTFKESSVIDYAISSICSMKILHNFQIIDTDRLFSDGHAFLLIELRNKTNMKLKSPNTTTMNPNPSLKPANYQSFIDNISLESVNRIRETIQSYGPDIEKESITNIVGQISDLLNTSASAAQGTPPTPSITRPVNPGLATSAKVLEPNII